MKHRFFQSLVIISLIILAGICPKLHANNPDNQKEKSCRAVIEHTRQENMDVFQGVFINLTAKGIEGTYTLETIREGSSGRSASRQGGEINVNEKQEKKLSKTSINIEEGDYYKVVLKVHAGDALLCTDSITVENKTNKH